jgi:hypothetical protein
MCLCNSAELRTFFEASGEELIVKGCSGAMRTCTREAHEALDAIAVAHVEVYT